MAGHAPVQPSTSASGDASIAVARCALHAGQAAAGELPANDFAAFTASISQPARFEQQVLTLQIVEGTSQAFAVTGTECLWAGSAAIIATSESSKPGRPRRASVGQAVSLSYHRAEPSDPHPALLVAAPQVTRASPPSRRTG